MAQSNAIMAFRKRLKGIGYTDISIVYLEVRSKQVGCQIYSVSARDPLAGELVRRECSETEMHHMIR